MLIKRGVGAALVLACCLVLPAAVQAAAQQEEDKSVRQLRSDLRKAERRFQQLYDKLNDAGDQDMQCADSAPTGTRFAKRSCTTRASQEATSRAAQDYLDQVGLDAAEARQSDRTAATEGGGPTGNASQTTDRRSLDLASVDLNEQQQAYRQNVARLMAEHPELRERADEYAAARLRLEAAEKRQGGSAAD